jgi:cell wall-associated NlpC family hydrolase
MRRRTVTPQFAGVGRSSAIVALSTGLVAAVALPAQAIGGGAPSAAATALDTSSATAFTATSGELGGILLDESPDLALAGGALTAPSTATVSFEADAFTAVPKAATVQLQPSQAARAAKSAPSALPARASSPIAAPVSSARGSSVLAIAARYVGTPYVYGGTTPRGFDCSGFNQYVFRQLKISLPRTANQQMLATRRISRSQARAGDLVFFVSGGEAYHTGIYAGNGMLYDAPHTGKSVSKRKIWDSTAVFTRVIG